MGGNWVGNSGDLLRGRSKDFPLPCDAPSEPAGNFASGKAVTRGQNNEVSSVLYINLYTCEQK